MRRPKNTIIPILVLGMVLALLPGAAGARPRRPLEIQILTLSDWHGQLDPLSVFGEGTFGGAAELAAYFDQERAANPNTLLFTAGDAVGASPPLSNFFGEEPAIRAMRMMGVDADTLGNHNFDRGIDHLQGLVDIARRRGNEPGEPFPYVVANLDNAHGNLRHIRRFQIFKFENVRVAVIGVINPEAPGLVFPGAFGPLAITDPVAAANAAREQAARQGADVFVLLSHMGVTGFDANGAPSGPLVDLANGVNGFDMIAGDHTNVEYTGVINGQTVVENRSKGRTYARIPISVDRRGPTPVVTTGTPTFVEPFSDAVAPDQEILDFLTPLRDQLTAVLGTVVGQSTVFVPRSDSCGRADSRLCESLVGNVVTDAMRAAYGTDFAITNAGGLRSDLTCPTVDNPTDFCPPPDGGDHEITLGQVLTVLPFGNSAVTLSVTGPELKAHLENGVAQMPAANGRFPQVSGLCFSYDINQSAGSRVTSVVRQGADGACSGSQIDLTAASTYTLAENDFTSSGGDGYPADIGSAVTRDVLDQVLADHITASTPISPAIQGRITCTSSGTQPCPPTL